MKTIAKRIYIALIILFLYAPTLLKLHDGGVDDDSSLAISVSPDVKKESLLVDLHVN